MTDRTAGSYLQRISSALNAAAQIANTFTPGKIHTMKKQQGDPVTQADLLLDRSLKEILLDEQTGWLSEETADNPQRLKKKYVWIVDPLDGTKEFVAGIDEFCISIALVRNGQPLAAGICNPMRNETYLGSLTQGVTLNGQPVKTKTAQTLQNATVLASRSEVKRGQWDRFKSSPFNIVPMGSVAYKLARVAAGLDDITFTLVPKNEWDIAAGVMLVNAAGGKCLLPDGSTPTFNNPDPLKPGLIAAGKNILPQLLKHLNINTK